MVKKKLVKNLFNLSVISFRKSKNVCKNKVKKIRMNETGDIENGEKGREEKCAIGSRRSSTNPNLLS